MANQRAHPAAAEQEKSSPTSAQAEELAVSFSISSIAFANRFVASCARYIEHCTPNILYFICMSVLEFKDKVIYYKYGSFVEGVACGFLLNSECFVYERVGVFSERLSCKTIYHELFSV